MKTPTTRREGNLRDVLVQEGRLMFEQAGATELSMREIARRVGVSEAAPFKHFRGKEQLLEAIASSGFRELRDERQRIVRDQADPLARARAMMLSYIAFARAHEGLFSLMIDLQHGPGIAVHWPGLHTDPQGCRRRHLHGWQGPVDGQCLYRTAVALGEMGMCLPAGVRNR